MITLIALAIGNLSAYLMSPKVTKISDVTSSCHNISNVFGKKIKKSKSPLKILQYSNTLAYFNKT